MRRRPHPWSILPEYERPLVHLFALAQQLKADPTPTLALRLQEELIDHVEAVERRLAALAAAYSRLEATTKRRALATGAERPPEGTLECAEYDLRDTGELRNILRDVGDAIVFSFVPRWHVRAETYNTAPLCDARRARTLLREIFAQGGVAILNCLTNCLEHDEEITLINGDDLADANFEEIASLSDQLSFEAPLYNPPGVPVLEVPLDAPVMSCADVLNAMLPELDRARSVSREVEPGLFYALVRDDATETDHERLALFPTSHEGTFYWLNTIDRSGYYPLQLSFDDPQRLFDFYDGHFLLIVALDCDCLKAELERRGFAVTFLEEEGYALELVQDGSDVAGKISRFHLGRVAAEFVSLAWLIDDFIGKFAIPWDDDNEDDPATEN